ncbi:MAG TPA: hypothetical protein VGB83_12795 [Actinomycetota bacterium]
MHAESWNLLEWTFVGILALMVAVSGLFGVVVVARLVEPRGMRALLRRLLGRA